MANYKILMSTYVIRLRKQRDDRSINMDQCISEKSFAHIFKEYLVDLAADPYSYFSNEENINKRLEYGSGEPHHTLTNKNEAGELESTIYYGYFDSGLSGKESKIKNLLNDSYEFFMTKNHSIMIPTFYYLHIPRNRSFAYLILQRQSAFGIKGLFENSFKLFLQKITPENQKTVFSLENFIITKLFEKIIQFGSIKEIELISHTMPNNYSELYDKEATGFEGVPKKVKVKTVLTTSSFFPLKGLAMRLFYRDLKNDRGGIEIKNGEKFDEINFKVNYSGMHRTLYMNNFRRWAPDYDITENVIWENDRPATSSLLQQAKSLIEEMELIFNSTSV